MLEKVWLLFLFALPVLAIPAKRAIERRVIRWFDQTRYNEARYVRAVGEENPGQFSAFSPVASTLSLMIPSCLLALSGTSLPTEIGSAMAPGAASTTIVPLSWLFALCLLLIALYLHYSGRGTRKLKYEVVLTALVVVLCTNLFIPHIGDGLFDEDTRRSLFRSRTTSVLVVAGLLFVAAQLLMGRFVNRLRERSVVRLFSYIQLHVLWLLCGLIVPFVLLYFLIVRFHLVPRLARRPILYFRSFSSETSGPAFREIITPAAHRYGLVQGLAHGTQRVTDLQGSIDFNQQAHLRVLPDDRWQDWVLERLRVASLILFDTTGNTAGMAWEIEAVVSQVSPNRIAFLCEETESDSFPVEFLQIRYSLKGKGPRRARATLKTWIKHRLLEISEPPNDNERAPTPRDCAPSNPVLARGQAVSPSAREAQQHWRCTEDQQVPSKERP